MAEVGFSSGGGGGEGRERVVLCKVYRTPRSAPVPAPRASTRGTSDSAVADSPRPAVQGPPGTTTSDAEVKIDPPQYPSRSSGRRPRSDLEEGEFVPSDDDSAVCDGVSRYVVQHRHGNDARPEIEPRRIEGVVVDGCALTSCERDSDGTVSDIDADAGAASLAQELTAMRGSVGRRSVCASSDNPTNQVVVHPPCSPQFLQGHQPAAPQVVVAQAQPTVAQGQQLAEAAPKQFVVHHPAPTRVVLRHVQRTSPPQPARDEQVFWLCKEEEGCGQGFATHRGLGGHMAGHKNRQNDKSHPCKHCPRVFTSGYQVRRHMGTHPGKVTPKKPGARHKVSALALSLLMPPAAMEVAPAQPAVAPSLPGVLRLFGVNIVPGEPPASAAEEVSSTVTETDQSSTASTNIER